MKIWLDDERDPKDQFVQDNYGANGDERWCKTVQECANLIRTGKVESISFDNDLGPGNDEGYKLANWIEWYASQGKIPKMKWYVHTQNTVAYKKICIAMQNADKYWNQLTVDD